MKRQTPIVALAVAKEAAYQAALIGSPYAKMHGDCENPFFVDVSGQGTLLLRPNLGTDHRGGPLSV